MDKLIHIRATFRCPQPTTCRGSTIACLRCLADLAGDTWSDPAQQLDWDSDLSLSIDDVKKTHPDAVSGTVPWSVSVWGWDLHEIT